MLSSIWSFLGIYQAALGDLGNVFERFASIRIFEWGTAFQIPKEAEHGSGEGCFATNDIYISLYFDTTRHRVLVLSARRPVAKKHNILNYQQIKFWLNNYKGNAQNRCHSHTPNRQLRHSKYAKAPAKLTFFQSLWEICSSFLFRKSTIIVWIQTKTGYLVSLFVLQQFFSEIFSRSLYPFLQATIEIPSSSAANFFSRD